LGVEGQARTVTGVVAIEQVRAERSVLGVNPSPSWSCRNDIKRADLTALNRVL
jgi:hypothetical protein